VRAKRCIRRPYCRIISLAEADRKILEGQRAILCDFAERQARG
jgi:predicted NUDIX family NTP pyrophosphohydrolase